MFCASLKVLQVEFNHLKLPHLKSLTNALLPNLCLSMTFYSKSWISARFNECSSNWIIDFEISPNSTLLNLLHPSNLWGNQRWCLTSNPLKLLHPPLLNHAIRTYDALEIQKRQFLVEKSIWLMDALLSIPSPKTLMTTWFPKTFYELLHTLSHNLIARRTKDALEFHSYVELFCQCR